MVGRDGDEPGPLKMMRVLAWVIVVALGGSCARARPENPELVVAKDTDPEPTSIRISLTARVARVQLGSGAATEVWTYNGTIPGPVIEARVGDKLTVDFRNELPEATTIHWHGVRVPNSMDGVPMMMDPIQPNGAFTYEFVLKDAGLFWFHPHVRADLQVQRGLYGVLRVREEAEPEADVERILVLDDVKLRDDGSISDYLDDTSAMIGREGNTLLVNGALHPVITLPASGLARLRVVNTANARYFRLGASGLQFIVLGTDGSRYESPFEATEVLLVPGERVDLFVRVPASGEFELMTLPYERGHDTGKAEALPLATIRSVKSNTTGAALPISGPTLERLPPAGTPFRIKLSEAREGEVVRFFVNDKQWPLVDTWAASRGVQSFEVVNESEMDHPFHLHGFFFQVLSRDGVAEDPTRLVWKDTINVPAKSRFTAATRFDEPGVWLYHCHILEHAEAGMMGSVTVP